MICNKKYHFVVPSKQTGAAFGNYEGPPDSGKGEWRSIVGVEGHALHGVIHSNGFGHLLCVNGPEMGSDLAGRHIMDFWDRLCTGLRARSALILSLNTTPQITISFLDFICRHACRHLENSYVQKEQGRKGSKRYIYIV